MPAAALVAVAMAASVSGALTVDRIAAGTTAAGGWLTVSSARDATSLTAPGG